MEQTEKKEDGKKAIRYPSPTSPQRKSPHNASPLKLEATPLASSSPQKNHEKIAVQASILASEEPCPDDIRNLHQVALNQSVAIQTTAEAQVSGSACGRARHRTTSESPDHQAPSNGAFIPQRVDQQVEPPLYLPSSKFSIARDDARYSHHPHARFEQSAAYHMNAHAHQQWHCYHGNRRKDRAPVQGIAFNSAQTHTKDSHPQDPSYGENSGRPQHHDGPAGHPNRQYCKNDLADILDYSPCGCDRCEKRNRSVYVRVTNKPDVVPIDLRSRLKSAFSERFGTVDDVIATSQRACSTFIIR